MAKAKKPFLRSMERVDGMLALHAQLHGQQGRPKQAVSDLLRGSLVLAVGALDGLVLDAVVEVIPYGLKRKGELGPNVAKWIKEDPDALLATYAEADPGAALVGYCKDRLSTMTFQKSAMIGGVLWDVARCPAPWKASARSLTTVKAKWTEKQVQDRLDEAVLRRHRIAHSGDTKPGGNSASPITLKYVREAAAVIKAVGLGVCEVVDARITTLRA